MLKIGEQEIVVKIHPWSNTKLNPENMILVNNQYISGLINPNPVKANPVQFFANDLNGIKYDGPTGVFRHGTSFTTGQIDEIIYELSKLKDYMQSIELANKLEKM